MPASLTFPSGPNFTGVLTPKMIKWRGIPPEGDRCIAANILWGTDDLNPGGAKSGVVNINVSGVSTQEFSQIAALFVDNTQSGGDVIFIFQDTQFEITVPAGSAALYPVLSTAKAFTVVALGTIAGDKTFLQILNSLPPPVALEKSVYMSSGIVTNIALVTGTSVILAAGINGTLTALQIISWKVLGGAAAGNMQVLIEDGTGKNIAVSHIAEGAAGYTGSSIILNLTGVNIRFSNGLNAVLLGAGTAFADGAVDVNLYYREP
jgi:hypothetical protein